jgi:hypothetical protein
MPDVFSIRDMEIRFEFNLSYQETCICHVYLGKIRQSYRFIDENHQYKIMCTYLNITYSSEQVYREIIQKILRSGQMRSSEMAMYEEYFGTQDMYSVTTQLKQRRQNQFEAKREVFEEKQKEMARNQISKLGITFWGSLIVEDILS